jgi:sugar phosphate isomerase/epimerase
MALTAARNIGVQSWSFRHFKTIGEMLAQVKAVGVSRIELCGAHAQFDDPTQHQVAIDACKAAGVEIVSIGVQSFNGDQKKEKHWFEFAKKAGATCISSHFNVENFREGAAVARALSEAYDIKVAVHCHGGYRFNGSVDEISHLIELGGGRIGLNIDTAWCLQSGGDPVEWAKKFKGSVFGTHYKDFVFTPKGKWSECLIGDGALDLPTYVKTLDETGFDGFSVIEYEAEVENPGPTIKKAVERIRAL